MPINPKHFGRLASKDGSQYEYRVLLREDTVGGVAQQHDIRRTRILLGERGASETQVIMESAAKAEFVISERGALSDVTSARMWDAMVDFARHPGTAQEKIVWKGYFHTDFNSRPFGQTPWPAPVAGKTGLNRLQNIDFDPIGDGWCERGGRISIAEAVAYCLSHLRAGIPLCTASGLYATARDGTQMDPDFPLAQLVFDPIAFYDTERKPPRDVTEDFVGYPTDCRTTLRALGGDANGQSGLFNLYQAEGPAGPTWFFIHRALLAEQQYERYWYTIGARGVSIDHPPEIFDPTRIEGEDADWHFFSMQSDPGEKNRHAHQEATAEYVHGPVPNLLRNPGFEIYSGTSNFPGWEKHGDPVHAHNARVKEVPGDDPANQIGLAFDTPSYDPDAGTGYTGPYGHYRSEGIRVDAGDLLKISGEVYRHKVADLHPSYEDEAWAVPLALRLEKEGGGAYNIIYFDQNPPLSEDARGGWSASIAGSSERWACSLLGRLGQSEADSFLTAPVPVDGHVFLELRAPIPEPDEGRRTEYIVWEHLRVDLVDARGSRQESESVSARLSGSIEDRRDPAELRVGDGPTSKTPGALYIDRVRPSILGS